MNPQQIIQAVYDLLDVMEAKHPEGVEGVCTSTLVRNAITGTENLARSGLPPVVALLSKCAAKHVDVLGKHPFPLMIIESLTRFVPWRELTA